MPGIPDEWPFGAEVLETAGKPVEGACLTDIRHQALRLDLKEKTENLSKTYEPRFSSGIWFFGHTASRFHEAYKDEADVGTKLKMAGDLARFGLRAIEAHFGPAWELNRDTINLFRELRERTGMIVSLIGGTGGDFRKREARYGTLSNRDPKLRQRFISETVEILKFAKDLAKEQGCPPVANVWPGTDGYVYSIGTDFYDLWDRFESGLAEAMDEVPGVRVTIEPKPYEPVVNSIYRHTADGLLFCRHVETLLRNGANRKLLAEGHAMVGMNPEIGHMKMGVEDVAYSYARAMREARLAHIHVNSVPLGSYDQDLNVGVSGTETMESVLFILRMHGYRGFMGMDLNPEYMDARAAVANSMNEVLRANAVVDALNHRRLLEAYASPEKGTGVVEHIITSARCSADASKKLVPFQEIEKWNGG